MHCSVNMSQCGSEELSVTVARRVASVVRTCIERDGHRKALCFSGRDKPPVSRIREKKQANDTKVLTDAAFVVRQLLRRFSMRASISRRKSLARVISLNSCRD